MSVYDDLGIRPTINAWGTVTEIGGSLMDERVLDAMREAAGAFVDVTELLRVASARIAEDLGVEAALITSGAAAAISVATAACLTGADPDLARALPHVGGERREVLMLASHRTAYEQQLRLAGAEVVHVDTDGGPVGVEQILAATRSTTAMFFFLAEASETDGFSLGELHAALAPLGIPVVVDAAGELPTPGGAAALLRAGADLLILSGGKELRGPQSSGLLLGSRALIDACRLNAFPNDSIGRGMKLDKETIVGLMTAVRLFAQRDEAALARSRDAILDDVSAAFAARSDVAVTRFRSTGPRLRPASILRLAIRPRLIDTATVRARLLAGTPRVAVGSSDRGIEINPQCLTEDEVPALVAAISAVLDGAAQTTTPSDDQLRVSTSAS